MAQAWISDCRGMRQFLARIQPVRNDVPRRCRSALRLEPGSIPLRTLVEPFGHPGCRAGIRPNLRTGEHAIEERHAVPESYKAPGALVGPCGGCGNGEVRLKKVVGTLALQHERHLVNRM